MVSQRTVRIVAVVLLVALVLSMGAVALGQEPPAPEVPTQDIVPEPNSGRAPTEAGDRGGALQLGLLGVVVLAIGGVAWHLARQSRRAKEASRRQPASASQAPTPSRNPDR